ncbi:MAG: ABC transporter permease [Bernardetiaceae bacterium]|nr:ABC transporter permease [Bernardetiaceae bacterium]
MNIFQLWFESLRFSVGALRENLLRTLLSLLGVTVGIFAIIGVLTMVEALERGIKDSLSFLGDKVIYVQKWPWTFSENYPWWEYVKRPQPTISEFEFLEKNLQLQTAISAFINKGNATLKTTKNSLTGVGLMGITYGHNKVADMPIAEGRYFTRGEMASAARMAIIGADIAADLFPNQNPIDKTFKMKGIKFRVIGVLKRQGDSLIGDTPSNDNLCVIPYKVFAKMYKISPYGFGLAPSIAIKGYEDDKNLASLEGEVRGLMRAARGLRPREKDSFALNRPEMFAVFIDQIIGILQIAGWIIGGFSILVGGFGIANIMFVSVRERTNIIGIQKALGAKNNFILLQFLFEAIFLSLIGGGVGLLLVSLLSFASTETFIIILSFKNILIGIVVSSAIGIISGIAPALMASKLNPVEAIRSGV